MRLVRTAAVVAAFATLVTPSLTGGAQAASSAKPGPVGGRVLLQDEASFSGFDVGYDAGGTAYIGWIASSANNTRLDQVHLCTVKPNTSSCAGGIQTGSAVDASSAAGLKLLVTPAGLVTMVWSHDVSAPAYLGRDARIAETTSQSGGLLSPSVDVADAPTSTTLFDAVFGPGGAIWTGMEGYSASNFELREGVTSAPITVATPYVLGFLDIAFSGSTPVIAIGQAGRISDPVMVSHGLGGFTAVPKTWTVGSAVGLVTTKSGVRLISSEADAGYRPVVAKWTGSSFSTPKLSGNPGACQPSSHDLGSDASGRAVDISNECSSISVANLANTVTAARVKFSSGGTVAAGDPQIASTPRGHAIAVWGIESPHVGNRLYFNRILLPGLDTSVSKSGVTVTGPTSCQPASTIGVSVKGAKAGWKVSSTSLTFGGRKLAAKATIDGSKLKAGKVYALVGKVVFTKGGASSVGTETLKFRSCINP